MAGALSRMNGDRFWGFSIWPIPQGQVWPDVDMDHPEFLQSAGDASCMSVELRELDADGVPHQYVVGQPGTTHQGERTETVTWAGGHQLHVYPGEVYTSEEAAPVYLSYYDTGTVPAGYVLRELDLSEPQ